jgi:hypothetical protein
MTDILDLVKEVRKLEVKDGDVVLFEVGSFDEFSGDDLKRAQYLLHRVFDDLGVQFVIHRGQIKDVKVFEGASA